MQFLIILGLLLSLPMFVDGDDNSSQDEDLDLGEDDLDLVDDEDFRPVDKTINGTDQSDDLQGSDANDILFGFAGADTMFGNDGDDTLYGGKGDDLVGGSAGDDEVNGDDGHDTLEGWLGNDTVNGGTGFDLVLGHEGDDLLNGDDGDDYLSGDAGADTLNGGNGNDRLIDYDIPFDDGPNPSVMDGGAGNDVLLFDGGSTITGGEGEDELRLYDTLADGNVTVITDFDHSQDRLNLTLDVNASDSGELTLIDQGPDAPFDLYYGDALIAQISGPSDLSIDQIDLRLQLEQDAGEMSFEDGAGDATIYGNHYANTINGGDGDDLIVVGGLAMGDTNYQGDSNLALGGAGDDTLSGMGGEVIGPFDHDGSSSQIEIEHPDTLIGGAGDDVLLSFGGNEMTGGAGADIFAIDDYAPISELDGYTFPPAVVTDFDPAEDVIVLGARSLPDDMSFDIEVWADGTGSNILVDGIVVAQITGGQNLTVADVQLIDWLGALSV